MGGSIRNSCSPTFESININLLHTRDNNLGKAYVVLPSKLYFLVHIHLRSMQPPMLDAVLAGLAISMTHYTALIILKVQRESLILPRKLSYLQCLSNETQQGVTVP